MRFPEKISLLFPVLFFSVVVHGQDNIYLSSDIRQGKIVDISSTVIKYHSPYNARLTLLLPAREALIIFNKKGDYLIPARLDPGKESSREQIARFLSADSTGDPAEADQIFTKDRLRVTGQIVKEDSLFVYLPDSGKLDKSNIVVIAYKNGVQKVFGNIDSAAAILWDVQQSAVKPGPQQAGNSGQQVSPGETRFASNAAPAASETAKEQADADSARERSFRELAGDISSKEFEERAVQKTNKLNEYLKILCLKSTGYEKKDEAIDQAVSLFVSENAMVETSSIRENVVHHYKIRQYLTQVKLFKYDKIEIEWTHVQYVSNLKLGPDGNYYGVVSFEQVFRGYRDNQLVYSDITRKNANVVLKTYKKSYEGTTKTIWDVLLSDIGVVYTKSSDSN